MADKRVYHVVKRSEDNKWEVKANGDSRPLKLFETKEEALEYAKEVAKNQEGTVLVHNTKGEKAGKIAESYDYGKKKASKSTIKTSTAKAEPKEEARPKSKKELKAEAKAKKKADKEKKKAAKKAAKKK